MDYVMREDEEDDDEDHQCRIFLLGDSERAVLRVTLFLFHFRSNIMILAKDSHVEQHY